MVLANLTIYSGQEITGIWIHHNQKLPYPGFLCFLFKSIERIMKNSSIRFLDKVVYPRGLRYFMHIIAHWSASFIRKTVTVWNWQLIFHHVVPKEAKKTKIIEFYREFHLILSCFNAKKKFGTKKIHFALEKSLGYGKWKL